MNRSSSYVWVILGALAWGASGLAPAAEVPRPAIGAILKDCRDCPALVVVPPGEFKMGSLEGDPDRPETPVRTVHIAYRFAVGRTSVTTGQFAEFVAKTGYKTEKGCGLIGDGTYHLSPDNDWRDPGYGRPAHDDEPVVCVSWTDAKAYVNWLSHVSGFRYRLLSEAEWEYAARAGKTTHFPWGDSAEDACRFANLYDRSAEVLKMPWPLPACSDGFARVAPVASFPPNAFGLYDMIGNTWQWTEDCYLYEYPEWPVDGTPVEVKSACPLRSIRGGSWGTRVERLRPSWRGRDPEYRKNILFGFRVARDIEPRGP